MYCCLTHPLTIITIFSTATTATKDCKHWEFCYFVSYLYSLLLWLLYFNGNFEFSANIETYCMCLGVSGRDIFYSL